MKLEEVLPAMREGRVATQGLDGTRYRFRSLSGTIQWWNDKASVWMDCYDLPGYDGWDLEPEPKFKWPRGSFQWALSEAGDGGSITRLGWSPRRECFVVGKYSAVGVDDILRRDWCVVTEIKPPGPRLP